jgi:hypothetical protein
MRRLAVVENYRPGAAESRRQVDPAKLWAGGAATALVCAGLATAGILLMRGIFGIDVIVPMANGGWHEATVGWYALGAGVASLAATALMHLLILFTPRPMRFFTWIVTLGTVVAMTVPFMTNATIDSILTTAVLNLLLGVAIGSLVTGTAHGATRVPAPSAYPPYGPGPVQR